VRVSHWRVEYLAKALVLLSGMVVLVEVLESEFALLKECWVSVQELNLWQWVCVLVLSGLAS